MDPQGGMMNPPLPPPNRATFGQLLAPVASGAGSGGNSPVRPESKSVGLARLFFAVERTLSTIASAAPQCSEEIDEITEKLRNIMTSIQNGKHSGGASGYEESGPTSDAISSPY